MAFPLNPENWSVFIDSGIPCVSMYDRRKFIMAFPRLILLLSPKETSKTDQSLSAGRFSFLYSLLKVPRNLTKLPALAAIAVAVVVKNFLVKYILHSYHNVYILYTPPLGLRYPCACGATTNSLTRQSLPLTPDFLYECAS